MKKNILAVILLLAAGVVMGQASWKSPQYKPEPYRKVMVLAKVTNTMAKRQLEDFAVKFLADKGIVAIPAYSNMPESGLESREAFLAKADSMQVDALLAFSVEGAERSIENTPTVSVGVGVGMYGGYMGASAPIAGGAKQVIIVKVSADFYNRASTEIQWTMPLSGKLEENTDKLAYSLAKTTVKAMFKDGLFITRK